MQCGIEYQTRSGLIALLHRLGLEHRKPKAISRQLDPAKQEAFVEAYEGLLNQLSADEVWSSRRDASDPHGAIGGLLDAGRDARRGATKQWAGSSKYSWRHRS